MDSIRDWIPGAKKLEDKLWRNLEIKDLPKFGQGKPLQEKKNCPEITAFFACYGIAGLTVDKRRLILPSTSSIIDAKFAYIASSGKPMNQDIVSDENYFVFGEKDVKRPLWYFSNQCLVNLTFTYSDHIMKPFQSNSSNVMDGSKLDANSNPRDT